MTGVVLLVTAPGAVLVAGAFAVFSVMVMPTLAALPGAVGMSAMRSVNRTAVRPVFLTLLFGTGLLGLVLGGMGLSGAPRPAVLAGGALMVVVLAGGPD